MAEFEESKKILNLAYVIRDDGSYGGWRTELLVEEIKGEIEAKFLLCNCCRGVLRDAFIYKKDGKHEVACSLCIPKDVVEKENASMNRETINEKKAHCPLKGCDWTNELSKLLHHLEECSRDLSQGCPYSQYGCDVKVLKRNLEQHEKEDMHKHLKLTINNMQSKAEQEKENAKLRTKIVQLEKDNEELKKSYLELKSPLTTISTFVLRGNIEWKISGVKKKISQKEDTYSETFYVGLYKFQGNVQWVSNDNFVGLFLCIMKGEWDNTLKWPIRYKRSTVLINQLDGKGSYEKNTEILEETLMKYPDCFNKPNTERNRSIGLPEFISHADILQEKYSKDDSITFKISVELISDP